MVHQFTRWLRGMPVDRDTSLNLLAGEWSHGLMFRIVQLRFHPLQGGLPLIINARRVALRFGAASQPADVRHGVCSELRPAFHRRCGGAHHERKARRLRRRARKPRQRTRASKSVRRASLSLGAEATVEPPLARVSLPLNKPLKKEARWENCLFSEF